MDNSAPSKTQGRRVFEYDAQYLFLVPELAVSGGAKVGHGSGGMVPLSAA